MDPSPEHRVRGLQSEACRIEKVPSLTPRHAPSTLGPFGPFDGRRYAAMRMVTIYLVDALT